MKLHWKFNLNISFKKDFLKFLFYLSCIVCAPCVCNGHRGQKKVSENHHAGIRIPSQVLCKNSQCSSLLSSLQPQQPFVFNSEWFQYPNPIFLFLVFVCMYGAWVYVCTKWMQGPVEVGNCVGSPRELCRVVNRPHADAETGPVSSASAASALHHRAISSLGLAHLNLEV